MVEPTPRRPPVHPDYGVPADLPETFDPWSVTAAKLAGARNYWVATGSAERGPHAAPVWGLWVDDEFWFSTDARSVKGRYLLADPRVTVHLESGDDVVIVTGEAELVDHTDPRIAGFIADYEPKYDMKFPSELPEMYAFWRLTPRNVSVWTESDFVDTAVRWDFA